MRRMAMTVAVVALALGWASPGVAGGTVNTPRKPFDVQVQRDFVYRTVGGDKMKLDAYLPGGTGTGPLPGVVVLFGGGWVLGSKELSEPLARTLAEQGFAAFAVDYRLAPAHPFPAAIDDVQASVKWLREHAIEFNLDPDHIGAIGGSAGGHLSALASTLGDGPHDRGSRLAAAVSWAGPMDLHPDEYGPDSQFYLDAFLDCPTGQCKESTIEAASPIFHVDQSDGAMFLANGQEDVLVPPDQAERMAAALGNAGVAHQLTLVPNAGHDERLAPVVIQPSIDFLRAKLEPSAKGSGVDVAPIIAVSVAGLAVGLLLLYATRSRRRSRRRRRRMA